MRKWTNKERRSADIIIDNEHAMNTLPKEANGHEFYHLGTIIRKALEPLKSSYGILEIF